ncbi:TIGR03087 family PEP-CTERM/XrtA system glycosyltransferase [Caenispirillum salinarum]|uniref:TIGR03087 family PEP-CTERM/XrtA system glycosyltransferase n=1 Tax=Caenispirillum salinarum TaxID=859058 RepID=UPI00384FFF27
MADVLFLTQRIPYPPDKGEKIRSFHLMQRLLRHHRIHLGCLLDDPSDLRHLDTLRDMVADLHVAVIDRRRARLTSLSALATGGGLSVAYFRHRALRRWVNDVLTRVKPEAAVVFSSNMAPYVLDRPPGVPRPPRLIADVVDVDSEKFAHYAREGARPMRWVYRREAAKVAGLERRLGDEADVVTLVSEPEADVYRHICPDARARVRGIPNGVDLATFTPDDPAPSPYADGGPVAVMVGHMDYPPNIDAAMWFAREILPLARRRVPDLRFAVVGANPAREVRALAELPGVMVTGRVPEVVPYVNHADVCVAPLRIARGIQNKVLEAMAVGRPVVTTTGALTGIAAMPERDVLVADTPAAFADSVVEALEPARGAALGEAARRFVEDHHAWNTVFAPFDAMIGGDSTAAALGAAE